MFKSGKGQVVELDLVPLEYPRARLGIYQHHPISIQSTTLMTSPMTQALGRGLGTDGDRHSFCHPGVTVLSQGSRTTNDRVIAL